MLNIRFVLHQKVSQTKFGYVGVLEAINLGRSNKMSTQVLTNKLNPHCESATINVQELELIADVVDANLDVAEYFASKVNAVVFKLPADDSAMGDMSLLEAFMDATIRAGDFAQEFQSAWADGRITPNEFNKLRDKLHGQIATQLAMLAKIEQVM